MAYLEDDLRIGDGVRRKSPRATPARRDAIVAAVDAAVDWMRRVQLTGQRLERRPDPALPGGFDVVVVNDPGAPPLWARFYDIETNRPIFSGRDGVIRGSLAEIEHERRTGYAWLGTWPQALVERDIPRGASACGGERRYGMGARSADWRGRSDECGRSLPIEDWRFCCRSALKTALRRPSPLDNEWPHSARGTPHSTIKQLVRLNPLIQLLLPIARSPDPDDQAEGSPSSSRHPIISRSSTRFVVRSCWPWAHPARWFDRCSRLEWRTT